MAGCLIFMATFSGTPKQNRIIPARFSHPGIIRYNHDGFIINGKPVFIYSGSFHYFRCDSTDWMDRLQKIKAAGFNTIETYVPWNWHERQEGKTNFEPLERFLDDCQQVGLYVIVRPGPYICAEWNVGGFPTWLEGKDVGFRTASPADIRWSKYWYDEVLPVIRKHLITNGGNIILMQIENEYNYYPVPDSQKILYLKSLYETAMKNRIDVPIITCWTKQVRDHSDPIFSQIMDACNFYPGWNIESTLPQIDQMKEEEPESPPMITELQGGWFSQFGDKSLRRVNQFGPKQISDLTDFVIAHGIKALSYYMLYGGTNFGYWGSFEKTTSYDYTAPISEPGGLWSKYRAVKLIGDFIRMEGQHLIDAHEIKDGARTDTPGVETILRTDGKSGFLFVWNKNSKPATARVNFKLSSSSDANLKVELGARGAYLLPVELPLPNGEVLHYTNVPISAIAELNGKPLIIAYGTSGQEASIHVGSGICKGVIRNSDQIKKCGDLYVLLTTEERASRSRVFESTSGPVTIISDSYLTTENGNRGNNVKLDLQTRPGNDSFSVLGPTSVSSISIDGRKVKAMASPVGVQTFSLSTQGFDLPSVEIKDLKMESGMEAHPEISWEDAPTSGDSVVPLDIDGDCQSGYTVYSGEIKLKQKSKLQCDFYFDDWHSVLVDGKVLPGLTGSSKENLSTEELSGGNHQIEILYENESWPNFGFMEQHKGLKSISCSVAGEASRLGLSLKYHYALPGQLAGWQKKSFDDSGWQPVRQFGKSRSVDGISWYRGEFKVPTKPGWVIPWRLHMESTGSAQIWINGRLLGRYSSRGPQKNFYMPDGWLNLNGTNSIVLVLRPGGNGNLTPKITSLYVAPYDQYVVQKHKMEISMR